MRERRRRRAATAMAQRPWGQPRRCFRPWTLISDDEVEAIHRASLAILRDTGVQFLSRKVRDFLDAQHGVTRDEETQVLRFDPELVESCLSTVASSFTLHARNPAHSVTLGEGQLAFTNVITPPYVSDLDGGKREGSQAEFEDLLRLCQGLNAVSFLYGYPVEPQDLPPETRHLDAIRSHIRLTDKLWRAYTTSEDRVRDAVEMARIARGLSPEALRREPSLIANVTTNSPLRIDEGMGEGLMIMAEANQPVSLTSFAMAGAIAPITLAGAIAQQNAEILAAVVLSQLVRAGAPLVYGTFTANVYMRSGAIAFGGPDLAKATIASGQLAQRYGMPLKSAVTTGAKTLDVQAGYETQGAIWAAIASGADIVAHAGGWMESGLTVSREKLIVDAEMIQMLCHLLDPLVVDEDSLALETIAEVGPGGQFFESPHTLARYKSEYYEPLVSDWESLETWQERGAATAEARANGVWKQIMADYREPALDPAIAEELDAYVARRRAEIEADQDP